MTKHRRRIGALLAALAVTALTVTGAPLSTAGAVQPEAAIASELTTPARALATAPPPPNPTTFVSIPPLVAFAAGQSQSWVAVEIAPRGTTTFTVQYFNGVNWFKSDPSITVADGTAVIAVSNHGSTYQRYRIQASGPGGSLTSSEAQLVQPTSSKPQISVQPRNVAAMLGMTAQLSLTIANPSPDTTVEWFYGTGSGTRLRSAVGGSGRGDGSVGDGGSGWAVGPNPTILITPELHGKQYWAVVTNAAGSTPSAPALMASVAKPEITAPFPTGSFAVSPAGTAPQQADFAARGGYATVATIVPFVIATSGGVSAANTVGALSYRDGNREAPGVYGTPSANRIPVSATQEVLPAQIGSTLSVEWRTCLIIPAESTPCSVPIPGASTRDGEGLSIVALARPVLVQGLPTYTGVPLGKGVQLGIQVESAIAPVYNWQALPYGTSQWIDVGVRNSESPYLNVDGVNTKNDWAYRVTATTPAGEVKSMTVIHEMRTDYYDPNSVGYKQVHIVNGLTSSNGDQPLYLTGSSGHVETPRDYLYLHTGEGVSTGWHFAAPAWVNTWFTMKIVGTSWNVKVSYWGTVSCGFWQDGTPEPEFTPTFGPGLGDSPYMCKTGSGTPYLTKDDEGSSAVVTIVPRGARYPDANPVLSGAAASSIGRWACSSKYVSCDFEGARTPTTGVFQDFDRVRSSCPGGSGSSSTFRLSASISQRDSIRWVEGTIHGFGATIPVAPGVNFKVGVEEDYYFGGGVDRGTYDEIAVSVTLMPGQVAYLGVTTPTVTRVGDVRFSLGGRNFTLSDTTVTVSEYREQIKGTTYAQDLREGATKASPIPYPVQRVVYVRDMTPAEIAACNAAR